MINKMRNILTVVILCLLPLGGLQAQDSVQSREDTNVVEVYNQAVSSDSPVDSIEGNELDSLASICQDIRQTQNVQNNLLMSIGTFSLFLLFLVVVLWIKLNKLSKKRKELRADFESFRSHPITLDSNYWNMEINKILTEVDRRIALSKENGDKIKTNDGIQSESLVKNTVKASDTPVTRYFGTNSNNYFVKVYEEQNLTTAFKVVFKNSSLLEGEFTLVDLNKIKSLDTVVQVIDFVDGCVNIESAKDVRVTEKGKVVKVGNNWKVVSKLKLKLY